MKKRKICAVITLIAFVLTMMPLMAFAASGSGSSISVDDSSAKADGKDTLKYIVDLDEDLNGNTVTKYVEVKDVKTNTVFKEGTYYTKDGDNYAIAKEYKDGETYYVAEPSYTEITPKLSQDSYLDKTYLTSKDEGVTFYKAPDKYVDGDVYFNMAVKADADKVTADNVADYYTLDNDGIYRKATAYDKDTTYYAIDKTKVTPGKYQIINEDCYKDVNGVKTEVKASANEKYDSSVKYYQKTGDYTQVNTADITKKVLAQDYYNERGEKAYLTGADYVSGTKYCEPKVADNKAPTQYLFIWAERSGSYSDADLLSLTENGAGESYLALDCNQIKKGETTVYVKSNTAGSVTLKAYLVNGSTKPTFAEVYNGSSDFIKTALVNGGTNGKFNATSSEITVSGTVTAYPQGKAGTSKAFAKDASYDMGLNSNNGVDYYYVSLKLKKGNSKLVGEKVTFSVDKNGATLNKDEATTSATGAVNFKVSATKADTYTVTVECGTYSESFKVTFGATDINKVKVQSYVKDTIAVDSNEEVAAEVVAYDSNGNSLKASAELASKINERYAIEVTKAPRDSSLDGEKLDDAFKYNPNESSYVYFSFTPDAVGDYTLKIYNTTTGSADYVYLTAKEFGTIKSATISYESSSYNLGSTTDVPTVKVVDANGVTKNATATRFSYSGIGVARFNSSNGVITFRDKDDYVGNKITVSVVVNNKVSASTTLTIGNEAAYLKFNETNGAVGEEVTVTGYSVDVDGNLSAIGTNNSKYDVKVQSAIITSKPEGANATIDASGFEDSANNFMSKGTGTVVVTSNKEGTVVGNVVLEITNTETKKTFYLAGVVTVNFGKATPNDNGYNKNITMIIGAKTFVYDGGAYTTDVAPYITNGRTMVAIRALAESTGAKVDYNNATRTVTITGKDLTATMIIGSNVMTVNGETKVMDVAASIKDGRTVIPVRYAAELLGYDFELTNDSNGNVIAVTMYQK